MPLLETVALSIGAAIAKRMVKAWLGDGGQNDVVQVMLNASEKKLTELLNRQPVNEKQVEGIADQVIAEIKPLFDIEARNLDQGERVAVVLAVGETLVNANIDINLVLEHRLDPVLLADYLRAGWPKATRDLGEAANLYDLLLKQITLAIAARAATLAGFDSAFSRTMLDDHNHLLGLLLKLHTKEDEEVARFEKEYRKSICSVLDEFDLFGIREAQRLSDDQSLNLAYITLTATVRDDNERKNDNEGDIYSLSQELPSESEKREQQRTGPIDHILAGATRFVISGRAGAGKSSTLRWLAVRIALQNCPKVLESWNTAIPFYIRLRQHVDTGFPTLSEFIEVVVDKLGYDTPDGWITNQLDNGRAIVLLDGIDELPKQKRSNFLRELRRLVTRYPYARYVVTSRPEAIKENDWDEWQNWIVQERFSIAFLDDMTLDQIDAFIESWYKAFRLDTGSRYRGREFAILPQRLQQLIRERNELRSLAVNPLLCAMICSSHVTQRDAVPAHRIELYRDCIDMLLEQRDSTREIAPDSSLPQLSKTAKKFLLGHFAYWMLSEGYSDVSVATADNYFDNRLKEYHLPKVNDQVITGSGVRHLLAGRSGLLQEPIEGRIGFVHRTFLHYLAAQRITDATAINDMLRHSLDDQWREPIILVAGMASEVDRVHILTSLLTLGESDKNTFVQKHYYLLAVACLETIEIPPHLLHRRVMQKASMLIPPKDEDEISLIAKAGEPAIELLHINPQHDAFEMSCCVNTLARIGSDTAMNAIIEYANSIFYSVENEISDLQIAVGRAWLSFDRQRYKERVLSNVIILYLRGTDVSDISMLAGLTSLQTLYLGSTPVSDISALAGLTSLQILELHRTRVSDISSLERLYSLQKLYLDNTEVSDISALSELTSLQTLGLYATFVSDIGALAKLTSMEMLSLQHTLVSDISPLAALTALQTLYLGNTSVSDISALAGLTSLQTLGLQQTEVNDISALAALTNLKSLGFGNTPINDISALAALTNLEELYLEGTKVSDVTTLAAIVSLKKLGLGNTPINDISALAGLTSLQTLGIQQTRVSDISTLAALTNLEELYLYDTEVSDISALAALTNLEELYLYDTEVSDISALAALTNLKKLGLSNTPISDISALAALTNLEELYLDGTKVSDITALAMLTSLQKLYLNGTEVNDVGALTGVTFLRELHLDDTIVSDVSALAKLYFLRKLSLQNTSVTDVSTLVEQRFLQILGL